LEEKAAAGPATPLPEDAATPEIKAQRLIAAALLKAPEIDRNAELYLAIQAFKAEDFARLMTGQQEFKAVLEGLRNLDDEITRKLAFGLVRRWMAVDPEGVVASLPRIVELLPAKGNVRDAFVLALAKAQPDAVLQLVPACEDAVQRGWIIATALEVVAMQDARKAEAWLKNCSDPDDRRVAARAVRLGIVRGDPLRAVEVTTRLTDANDICQVMSTAAEQAAKIGPGMLRQLATMPMKYEMLAPVLDKFADADPDLAVELVLSQSRDRDLESQTTSVQAAFGALARRDPELALPKLEGLEGNALAAAVSAVGAEWTSRDPAAALAWLMDKPVSERSDPGSMSEGSNDALLMSFSTWFECDRDAARTWAAALPPGDERDRVEAQLARTLAYNQEPAEAAKVLAGLGAAADPKTLSQIAELWAENDPHAAAEWASAQPAGPLQAAAIASVVSTWARDDADATREWLAQFPPGEARDRSVMAFLNRSRIGSNSTSRQIAEFDAWFNLIDDPWQRSRAVTNQYRIRRLVDPAGARAWLATMQNVDPALLRIGTSNDE